MLVLVILLVLAATWVALRVWDTTATAAAAAAATETAPADDHSDGVDDDGSLLETVAEVVADVLMWFV